VLLLLQTTDDTHERALGAPVNNRRALILVSEQLFVGQDFLTTLVCVATSELDLAQKIPSHPVYAVKLALISAERASVWILLEPMSFAIAAQRFFTNYTLYRIF
jgi:hypothetical protein